MNNVVQKNLTVLFIFFSCAASATVPTPSGAMNNKASLSGLQISLGLVGVTAALAVTSVWFFRPCYKKEVVCERVQNFKAAQTHANKVDREIRARKEIEPAQKQQAHNKNILELVKARMHFDKNQNSAYSFRLAHTLFFCTERGIRKIFGA